MWSPDHPNSVLKTPQPRKQRIKTTSSYEKCKTLQTQQSRISPVPYQYNYSPESQTDRQLPYLSLMKEHFQLQGKQSIVTSKVSQHQINIFFKQMQLLKFFFKQAKDLDAFFKRKKEAVNQLIIKIENKESDVLRQKKRFERKVKKIKEKKMMIQKVKRNEVQKKIKKELNLIEKIKKLQQRLQASQISLSLSETELLQERKTLRKPKIQIKLPLILPMQSHYCSSCQNSSQYPRYNYPNINDTYSQSNGYSQLQELGYPKFVKTGKKMSQGRLRTQPSDGFCTRRSSKIDKPLVRYMQDEDFDGHRQLKTERYHIRKKDQSLINEVEFSLDPEKNMCSQQYKVNNFLNGKQGGSQKSKQRQNIEEVPLSEEERRWTLGKNDQDIPVLLEQSTRKFYDQNQYLNLDIPKMQKSSSVSSNEDNLKHSPLKNPRYMVESAVRIDFSDQQSSKISKNSKYNNTPNQYRNSLEQNFKEIEEESEQFTSLQTTPNNVLTPPQTPSNEILQRKKPSTPSHSSKNNSGITKVEDVSPDIHIPMKKNPLLGCLQTNGGISTIQLNLVSRNQKKVQEQKEDKESLFIRKYSDDDNLMSITLVGESKISRQKSSQLNQFLLTEKQAEKKNDENPDEFDFDLQLGAQSKIITKKPRQSSPRKSIMHQTNFQAFNTIEEENQDQSSIYYHHK